MKELNMRILNSYEGATSNILGVRDNGNPETMLNIFNSIGSLANNHGTRKDERYFQLVEIPREKMERLIEASLETQKELAKERKKNSIEKEIQKLKRELKELG